MPFDDRSGEQLGENSLQALCFVALNGPYNHEVNIWSIFVDAWTTVLRTTTRALTKYPRYKKGSHHLFLAFGLATLAWEHAFRLAELMHTKVPSVMARHWMMVVDWKLYAGGREIRYLPDGRPDPKERSGYTHCASRVGPSKTNGRVGGTLQGVYTPWCKSMRRSRQCSRRRHSSRVGRYRPLRKGAFGRR